MSLPFVLAGPVLKRVSPKEVWVWVAFSQPVDKVYDKSRLILRIFKEDDAPTAKEVLTDTANARWIGGGVYSSDEANGSYYFNHLKNLHVYLLKAVPKDNKKNFADFGLLSYELFVEQTQSFFVDKKIENRKVFRGLQEHLYATPNHWKEWRGGKRAPEPQTTKPPGLDGYRAEGGIFRKWVVDQLAKASPKATTEEAASDDANALLPVLDANCLRNYRSLWNLVYSSVSEELSDKEDKSIAIALPCFKVEKTGQPSIVWSGSCFKLTGSGKSATLRMFDDGGKKDGTGKKSGNLADCIKQAVARSGSNTSDSGYPQALVLTGDQIYADDVAFSLSSSISALSRLLDPEVESAGEFKDLSRTGGHGRFEFVERGNPYTPFTIDGDLGPLEGAYNHLLTFAEYCAYYLLHLNAALWPDLTNVNLRQVAVSTYMSCKPAKAGFAASVIHNEIQELLDTKFTIRSYGVVKSCVPAYELCDDHDVTDDWFINEKWMTRLLDPHQKFDKKSEHSELGCLIVSNAIHAYALVQAVGNFPDAFAERLDSFDSLRQQTRSAESAGNGRRIDGAYPHYFRLVSMLKSDWSFCIPLSAGSAICLDTRSHRFPFSWLDKLNQPDGYKDDFYKLEAEDTLWALFATKMRRELAGAISEQLSDFDLPFNTMLFRLKKLNQLLSNVDNSKSLTIFTPVPICSIDEIEKTKRRLPVSSERKDVELWRDNLSNFYRFVETLRRNSIETCLIVSGDLHVSYQRAMRVKHSNADYDEVDAQSGANDPKRLQVTGELHLRQVVCSALKNRWDSSMVWESASPIGDALRADVKRVCFNQSPRLTYAVEMRKEWQKSSWRYVETTFPLNLEGKPLGGSKASSEVRDNWYRRENSFVVLKLQDSAKDEPKIKFF